MDIPDKIPPLNTNAPGVRSIQTVDRTTAVEKTASRQVSQGGDRVEISAQARMLQTARDTVRQMPEVDEAKVAEIKARLQAGTYTPDSRTIAAKMIDEALLIDSE
jgi:negative regulator of flagellin synthesis FlgM